MSRRINAAGLALVKSFEGLRLTSYRCAAGVWTVGWGSTGRHVEPGMTITEAQAETLLKKDLRRFEEGVERLIGQTPTHDNEFSAMVSLAFNIGLAGFERSTVLKRHRQGNKVGAANAFLLWNKAGGRVLRGLVRRREAERDLYLAPAPAKPVEEAPAKAPPAPDLAPMTPNERDKALRPPAGCLAAILGMFRK